MATATATVVRTSPSRTVPSTVTVNGDQVVVDIGTTLASAGHYTITPAIDDGAPYTTPSSWTTRAAPSRANVKVLYFTAMAADARRDMLQRVDAANIVAVPRDSDVIDASSGSMTVAQIEARMKKHQVVLVVGGDADYAFPVNLGKALAWFQSNGHGVVTAGQTHWSQDLPVWSYGSAVGAGTAWDKNWAMYPDGPLIESDRIEGGQIQSSTIRKQFITAGLKSFTVIGPSTGEVLPRFGADLLANFKLDGVPGNRFDSFHQAFLAARQLSATRTVDLGYRPWSSAIDSGGFNPAVSPGGHLLARALLWAANRIPPANTHFTLQAAQPGELCPGALPGRRHRPRSRQAGPALPLPAGQRRLALGDGEHVRVLRHVEWPAHRLGVRGRLGRKPRSAHRPLHLHDQGQPQLTTAGGGSSVLVVYHRRR